MSAPDAVAGRAPDTGPSPSLRISGGGSTAVDTGEMLRAASVLAGARHDLRLLADRIDGALHGALPDRRAAAARAAASLREAARGCEEATDGLRLAAQRYGLAEQAAAEGLRITGAIRSAVEAGVLRVVGPAGLPVVVQAEALPLAGLFAARLPWEFEHLGRAEPWEDPVLLSAAANRLSSLDDLLRSLILVEGPADLVRDDPDAALGTAWISATAAALGWQHADGPLIVRPTTRAVVRQPRDLDDLAARLPDGATPEGQVRVERYEDRHGTRWIVYISGTVTFERNSGGEPFDMASNLLGVGNRPADSQRVVLEAMRQAGVRPGEPVLLVGHSQGALNAVRVAQHGGYDVGGVVQFGGPTGQIVLPEDVPVLSVEHDEDPVPLLGGAAALGADGARRLLIRRSLPDGGAAPGLDPNVPAHEMRNYRATVRMAEASGDPRVTAFRREVSPFFDGVEGEASRWRGDRVTPQSLSGPPARNPRGVAG